MISAYISEIIFRAGLGVKLTKDSILVLVGPNNSGKSATINEVRSLMTGNQTESILLEKISIIRESSYEQVLQVVGPPNLNGIYSLPGANFGTHNLKNWWNEEGPQIGDFLFKLIVSDLPTKARLHDCDPPRSLDFRHPFAIDHLFQQMYRNPELEIETSKVIRRAFKLDLVIHRSAGTVIPAYVGSRPILNDGEMRDDLSYSKKVEKLKNLERQGDGLRSFVSIAARVLTEQSSMQLIDEPEAFLHPPQSKMLAELLSSDKSNRQLILATHSSDILQGLLSGNSERVSVVRLSRSGEAPLASYLSASKVSALWRDPILRFGKALDGLFHDGVVVTESDADCRFYEAVLNAAVPSEERPDIHYSYSGGKERLPTLVAALRALSVPVAALVDFDVLNNEVTLKRIIEAQGSRWMDFKQDWIVIKNAVEKGAAFIRGDTFKKDVADLMSSVDPAGSVSKDTLARLRTLTRRASPWDNAKSSGLSAIPPGEATVVAERLLSNLQEIGVFVAPWGEMEGFCRSIGSHGAKWVEQAMARDLANDAAFENARNFVHKVATYLLSSTK